jgi:hypothetical protein
VGLAWSIVHLWRRPPDISQVGWTVLVYEVEESRPPSGDSLEDLPDALQRRLDPSGSLGITARLVGDRQVEIATPRSGDHDKVVQMARELVKQAGVLAFRIVANGVDDFGLLTCAATSGPGARRAPGHTSPGPTARRAPGHTRRRGGSVGRAQPGNAQGPWFARSASGGSEGQRVLPLPGLLAETIGLIQPNLAFPDWSAVIPHLFSAA